MTAQSKLRKHKKETASSFCPFAPVESFLVAKVSIWERRFCLDIDRVVTRLPLQPDKKLHRQRKEAASSFCPFAPVESFLVAMDSIGERRCCWDIDWVVT